MFNAEAAEEISLKLWKAPQYQQWASSTPRGKIIAKFKKSPQSRNLVVLSTVKDSQPNLWYYNPDGSCIFDV